MTGCKLGGTFDILTESLPDKSVLILIFTTDFIHVIATGHEKVHYLHSY